MIYHDIKKQLDLQKRVSPLFTAFHEKWFSFPLQLLLCWTINVFLWGQKQVAGVVDQYPASRVVSLCDITKGNISTLIRGKWSTQKMSRKDSSRFGSFDDSRHPQRTIGTVDFKVLFYRENTRQKQIFMFDNLKIIPW